MKVFLGGPPEEEPVHEEEEPLAPEPPADAARRALIDKLAAIIAEKGPEYEGQLIERTYGNPTYE